MSNEPSFADFLDDVIPQEQPDTIPVQHRQIAREQALARQRAASTTRQAPLNPLSDEEDIELVDCYDEVSYQRPGVQHGVFRKLRLGQYPISQRLDLHQLTVAQARQAVLEFIQQCQQHQLPSVLIIHGIGVKGKPPALLKSCVNHWLRQLPEIMAFHSSQKSDGGLGAVYVLLAKSAQAKQLNRERFQQRAH